MKNYASYSVAFLKQRSLFELFYIIIILCNYIYWIQLSTYGFVFFVGSHQKIVRILNKISTQVFIWMKLTTLFEFNIKMLFSISSRKFVPPVHITKKHNIRFIIMRITHKWNFTPSNHNIFLCELLFHYSALYRYKLLVKMMKYKNFHGLKQAYYGVPLYLMFQTFILFYVFAKSKCYYNDLPLRLM